jgi:signal transduction histidine kinase
MVVVLVENHGGTGQNLPIDPAGYGLTGLAERADLLEGRFSAAPTPDGFRVELAVPAAA